MWLHVPEIMAYRIKRILMAGLMTLAMLMFFQYLLWQLELNNVSLVFSSANKQTYTRLKQKIFNTNLVQEERCISSRQHFENITISKWKQPITSKNIHRLIEDSNLNLDDAFVSQTSTIFGAEAIMISGLPQFNARIPALVFHKNVFLAFCEARFEGVHDFGEMMIAMRRGVLLENGDVRWQKIQLIAGIRAFRTMNPSPTVDLINDSIVLMFAGFPSSMSFEEMMSFPSFPLSKLYVMTSYDLGFSWTDPFDITTQTILKIHPNPVLLVPGPGHSIQMKCGRIIVPVNFYTQDANSVHIPRLCRNCTNYNLILYSDNGGINWKLGQRSTFTRDALSRPIYLNEVQAVETDDNTLCLNTRTLHADHPRAISTSLDGGKSLSHSYLVKELVEPGYKKDGTPVPGAGCAGSVIGFDAPKSSNSIHSQWVLFSNPADWALRIHLSIRLSIDGCRTWSPPWQIFQHKAAYSDMTYLKGFINGKNQPVVAVLYEGGFERIVEGLKFKMFNLEAVLSGIKTQLEFSKR